MKALLNLNFYLPILNGIAGDKFAQMGDRWAIQMSFRHNGKDIATSQLDRKLKNKPAIIFVHGLMADERVWKKYEALEKDYAVLYVRYNTGLHISENGQLLAKLLHTVYSRFGWNKFYLAGHSMGGLVIRSACHYASKHHYPWIKKVSSIFLIAVPNAGAALAKLGHVTPIVLNKLLRWRLRGLTVGDVIEYRSNGIKDLRLGSMLDEDWKDNVSARATVPPVPGISYHILVGNLTSDEKSLMGKYFGDGLVHHDSAAATTLIKVATVKVFLKTGHNSILNNNDAFKYVLSVLRNGR